MSMRRESQPHQQLAENKAFFANFYRSVENLASDAQGPANSQAT
jgi:hypothetical protein